LYAPPEGLIKENSMTDTNTSGPAPRPDGAVHELARDDVERKKFLKMAGRSMGAAGAATALGAFIAACGSSSSSSSSSAAAAPATTSTAAAGAGDLPIVNYALTLEYLEADFYAKAIASGLFKGPVLATLKSFGAQEQEHVIALKKAAATLGTPAAKPTGKFPMTSAAQVSKLAATVENLGADAYLGQAANIQSKEILAAALAIHTIEARHAATLNTLLKMSPTPEGAFASPKSMAEVLAAVKPFIA
jgi:Ferritin-like domain